MYSSSSPLYSDSSTEIDSLACSSLPEFFYRVQYGSTSTKTTFDMENGFLADDPDLMINNLTTLKDRVQLAFTWSSRSASPFINVFSDRTHAENWALKWCRDGGIIYKISMAELGDMKVFKLSTMVQQFNIELVDGARQHEEGAYLCLHHIPIEAVMSYLDADNIANGESHCLTVQNRNTR